MTTPPDGSAECERLFQELIKYYRAAVVGRRITGIVHAINTPLQVILMQTELMTRKLAEEQTSFAPLLPLDLQPAWQAFFAYRQNKNQQLQEISANLQQLVHWLKQQGFHDHEHGPQEIDLNTLVQEELQGYQAEQFFKHRVTKRIRLFDRLPPLSGFYVDLSQSFCHLVDNALEALQEVPEPSLDIETGMISGRRMIAVGDNGPGIPGADRDRVFDPFFSTKGAPGKPRAGLGLFLTRRLLALYGGEVAFESRPGQTWFRLLLP